MMTIRTQPWDAANLVHTAHLTVQENQAEEFREKVSHHAEATRAEPGCLAFDVYQSTQWPGVFFLFEVYRDSRSLDAHRGSPHFLEFRQDVDGWVIGRQWWYWSPASLAQGDQGG